ncbi:flagellar basal body P-ring formation chaperone FlgA [uncultured Cohaesibacter sp.]|uniref:flagellar basal body P-ring formation chaperone FlgA n=1 Tax=uncultured Cohaesibacter sp. TaxID=1002546 RepID=UPI00292F3127|nr:flagellar basal body P-ring formation chaperone FlgA [uncultured Cohaesibacter sp.]
MNSSIINQLRQGPIWKRAYLVASLSIALGLSSLSTALSSEPAREPARLRGNVTVEARLVTVGDLFENAGQYAHKAVFRAPSIGQSGSVRAERVIDAAIRAGLRNIDPNNVAVVRVARASELVTESDVTESLKAILQSKGFVSATDRVDVELNSGFVDQHAAAGGVRPYDIHNLRFDRPSGRFAATLSLYGRNDIGDIRLTGRAIESMLVPVMTRTVSKGEIVSDSDITLRSTPKQQAILAKPAMMNDIIGMAAKQTIRAGTIANSSYFTPPDMVKRSDTVTIIFETGNLNLSISAKALANGAKGDVIPVQNSQTNRIIRAEVIEHGLLRITQPTQTVASLGSN